MKAFKTAVSHQKRHCHCLTILWLDQLSAVGIAGGNLSAPFPIIAGRQKFVLQPTTSYDWPGAKTNSPYYRIMYFLVSMVDSMQWWVHWWLNVGK